VIKYMANPVRAAFGTIAQRKLGMIVTPKQGNRLPHDVTWCADNGCRPTRSGVVGAAYPGDAAFLRFLTSHADKPSDCLFACAPDVAGDARATLKRSVPMLPKIRALGYRPAFVAQDDQEDLAVPWELFDVLFIGGSTAWKMGPAAARLVGQARAHGKQVHFGRVNSRKRLRYAAELGCPA
jgi:hypothetical protein